MVPSFLETRRSFFCHRAVSPSYRQEFFPKQGFTKGQTLAACIALQMTRDRLGRLTIKPSTTASAVLFKKFK